MKDMKTKRRILIKQTNIFNASIFGTFRKLVEL